MLDTFIVTGLPGAGKTTTSKAIARTFPLAAAIEGDVLSFDFVVAGLPDPFGDDVQRSEWSRHMDLRRTNTCLLADSYRNAGFVVVIDDFLTRIEDVRKYDSALERPVGLVVLAPPLEVIATRDAARDKQVFAAWVHKDAEMREHLAGHGIWIEDPGLTPEEVASLALAHIGHAVVPE
ncbi:MAG TPA: AAA family ATPase [Acidimicrobiales bacterium]|nr:AAA family ATPase [Acidimicrobiales bacterium]